MELIITIGIIIWALFGFVAFLMTCFVEGIKKDAEPWPWWQQWLLVIVCGPGVWITGIVCTLGGYGRGKKQ